MALPFDALIVARKRLQYNFDLIAKKYSNMESNGLELDIDSGKIVQVLQPGRKRLTPAEAKKALSKNICAPASAFGNSSMCSPFVTDMTVSAAKKRRVLKHNKRFERSLLEDFVNQNPDPAESEEAFEQSETYDKNEEPEEIVELFGIDEFPDDESEDEEALIDEGEDSDPESVDGDEKSDGEEDPQLKLELDNEPFEESEAEEKSNVGEIRVTRSLIHRLAGKPKPFAQEQSNLTVTIPKKRGRTTSKKTPIQPASLAIVSAASSATSKKRTRATSKKGESPASAPAHAVIKKRGRPMSKNIPIEPTPVESVAIVPVASKKRPPPKKTRTNGDHVDSRLIVPVKAAAKSVSKKSARPAAKKAPIKPAVINSRAVIPTENIVAQTTAPKKPWLLRSHASQSKKAPIKPADSVKAAATSASGKRSASKKKVSPEPAKKRRKLNLNNRFLY